MSIKLFFILQQAVVMIDISIDSTNNDDTFIKSEKIINIRQVSTLYYVVINFLLLLITKT
jgi:hypothetical protein